jgi:poly(A) polymerase
MLEHGLLVEVVACAPRPARLARLAGIEAAHGLAPSPARRLGALCLHVAEDARRLADRLRLSAEERRMLETMGADAPVLRPAMAEPAAKAALYAIGAEAWPERVLALWSAQADPADDAAWVTLLQLPGRWSVPSLPVRGADLLAIGIAPGKAVGELLRQLEDEWIDGGFVAGRGQLLARARELKG